jgi:apolipoprotein N-acyltransferase
LDFALALLSGALLALSFPKFGTPPFAWIALAPLLVALAHRRSRRAAPSRSACSTGAVYFAARSTGSSRR